MDYVLVAIGIIALIVGFFSLTQANMGAGLIAIGCFFGILARIVQADKHNAKLINILSQEKDVKS